MLMSAFTVSYCDLIGWERDDTRSGEGSKITTFRGTSAVVVVVVVVHFTLDIQHGIKSRDAVSVTGHWSESARNEIITGVDKGGHILIAGLIACSTDGPYALWIGGETEFQHQGESTMFGWKGKKSSEHDWICSLSDEERVSIPNLGRAPPYPNSGGWQVLSRNCCIRSNSVSV